MVSLPPEVTTLATFHVPLEDFLDGEFEFENVFIHSEQEEGSKTPESDVSQPKKVSSVTLRLFITQDCFTANYYCSEVASLCHKGNLYLLQNFKKK